MLLRDFFERYYAPLRLRNRSANTLRLYRYSLGAFERFLGRAATLDDLDNDTVGMYLADIARRKLSAWSIAKERSQLIAIWGYAAKRGLIQRWPDVPVEPTPKRAPVAWSIEEVERILAACRLIPGDIAGVPASLWWETLHRVLYDTGERIGAVLQLRFANVQGLWITVPAELRKGKRADKVSRLSARTAGGIEQIREPVRDEIFPFPLTQTYLWDRYKQILRAAGLPCDRSCMFHRMRRTVASHFVAAGGNATEQLGHSDPRVTQRYLDPRIVAAHQPADLLPPLG